MSTIQGELVREAIFTARDPLVEKQGKEKIEGATIRLEFSFHQHRGETICTGATGCWLVERDWPTPSKLVAIHECPYLHSHEPN